jgi:GNAT superfamily N-acetyltransferase
MFHQDVQLVSADKVSLAQRVAVMNAAYADYLVPIHVTPEQMSLMDRCFDISISRSVIARTRWDLVGMALLAIRGGRGWISGVGVLPAWRRQGVGRRMMEWLLEQARHTGLRQVTLEVISENKPARELYCSLGFSERRELLTWQRPATADPLPVPAERLSPVLAPDLLLYFHGWHDQPPSWQRDYTSVSKMASMLRGYQLDGQDEPAGYCIVGGSEDSVALVDVGINPDAGLLMPGRLMLQALAGLNLGRSISIMNVPADDALSRVLAGLRFLVTLRQVEMVIQL